MVSENNSLKTRNLSKNVWHINLLATQQFHSSRWLIFPSILIAFKELRIAPIAQVNQLFQLLNLVQYGHGFYEVSRMLLRQNVNNDASKDSPFHT